MVFFKQDFSLWLLFLILYSPKLSRVICSFSVCELDEDLMYGSLFCIPLDYLKVFKTDQVTKITRMSLTGFLCQKNRYCYGNLEACFVLVYYLKPCVYVLFPTLMAVWVNIKEVFVTSLKTVVKNKTILLFFLNSAYWSKVFCRSPRKRRSRSRSGSRKRKHRKRSRSRSRERKRKSSRSYSSERRAREREKERQKKGLPPIRSKTLSGKWQQFSVLII